VVVPGTPNPRGPGRAGSPPPLARAGGAAHPAGGVLRALRPLRGRGADPPAPPPVAAATADTSAREAVCYLRAHIAEEPASLAPPMEVGSSARSGGDTGHLGQGSGLLRKGPHRRGACIAGASDGGRHSRQEGDGR